MEKQLDMTKSRPNYLKKEEKSSGRSFLNSFKKYGRKRSHEWKYGIICPVHKKGDVMMCDNYTAVTPLCKHVKCWQIL
jgi:hypothetical protein